MTIRCVGNYGAQHASSLFAGRACACVPRVYGRIARLHVHARAFTGRNASVAPGNVTAATVSTAVAMSSSMADVEDGERALAFPSCLSKLLRILSAMDTIYQITMDTIGRFWKEIDLEN